jgi:hypothetical protein
MQLCISVWPVARLPASDLYFVASGDTVFARGEPIQVTRREASDWPHTDYVITLFLGKLIPGWNYLSSSTKTLIRKTPGCFR